jgi:hypothetical protein
VASPDSRRRTADRTGAGLVPRTQRVLARLAETRLLGRLIAGKVWIALVAFALIGIVTLQLGLLELNTRIGRSLEREATLQRENAALAVENSELAASERVHTSAVKLGFSSARTDALRFLSVHPHGDAGRAAAALAASPTAAAGSESSAQQSSGGEGAGAEAAGHEASSGGTSTAAESNEAAARERTGGEASSSSSAESPARPSGESHNGAGGEAEGGERSSASSGPGGGTEGASGGTGASPGG